MSAEQTKVAIVATPELHQFFTQHFPAWDTQASVETVEDMWAALQDGRLDAVNTEIVLMLADTLMQTAPDEFTTAVATFAPEALVLVLTYNTSLISSLKGLVAAKARSLRLQEAPFYALDANEDIGAEITNAIEAYEAWVAQAASGNISDNTGEVDAILAADEGYVEEEEYVEPAAPVETRKRGLVVASTSSKGGSGKTSVALCTATSMYYSSKFAADRGMREKPLRVCLVDLDTRDGQIGFLLGQQAPNALTLFVETTRLREPITEELLQNNLVYAENLGIHVLLAPKRARTADYLTPEFYDTIIEKLRYMFDVVIIDTSVNYLDPLLRDVGLPKADAILFVTNLSNGAVYGMTRWVEEVTTPQDKGGSGIDLDKVGVVVNSSAPGLGFDQSQIQIAAKGAHVLVAVPLDSVAMIAASNHNKLDDIILGHPYISPAYYTIARRLLPNEELVSPLEGPPNNGNGATPPAPAPVKQTKPKQNLFGRKR